MFGTSATPSSHGAPRGAGWILGLAIPLAFWFMLTAIAGAMSIGPLYDATPALVLAVAFLTRRWLGVATRWFVGASVLAGIMALEWIPWYSWMYSQRWPSTDMLNTVASVYALELLLLVILFTTASVVSIRGIRRERVAASESTLIDTGSSES
jgi:hypothetical protein